MSDLDIHFTCASLGLEFCLGRELIKRKIDVIKILRILCSLLPCMVLKLRKGFADSLKSLHCFLVREKNNSRAGVYVGPGTSGSKRLITAHVHK